MPLFGATPIIPPFNLGAAVQRALMLSGLKQEAAARMMQKDPSQFSKELLGKERLDFAALFWIDDHTFWRALLSEIGDHFGLAFDASDILMKAMSQLMVALGNMAIVFGKHRMAKATLLRSDAREKRIA